MEPSGKSPRHVSSDTYSSFCLYKSIKQNSKEVKGNLAFFNDSKKDIRNQLMAQIFKNLSSHDIYSFSHVNRSSYLMLKEHSPELLNFLIPGKSMKACVLRGGEREMYRLLENDSANLHSDRCLHQFSFIINNSEGEETILRPAVELEVGNGKPTLKSTCKKWIFAKEFKPTYFKDGFPLFCEWVNANSKINHFKTGDKVYFDLSRMPSTRSILFTPEDNTEEKIKFNLVAFFLWNCARIKISAYEIFPNGEAAKRELSKIIYLKLCELKSRDQFKTRDEYLEYRAKEQNAKELRFHNFFANMLKDPDKYYKNCELFSLTLLKKNEKEAFLKTLNMDRTNHHNRQELLKVINAVKPITPKKTVHATPQAEESDFDKFVSEKVNSIKSFFNF
jgi:hypothetical protein